MTERPTGWSYQRDQQVRQDLLDTLPGFAEAKQRAESEAANFVAGPISVVRALQEEVSAMPIASRFKAEGAIIGNDYNRDDLSVGMIMYGHLSEAEYKRQTLQGDLNRIRNELVLLAGQLKLVVIDIEATKTEG